MWSSLRPRQKSTSRSCVGAHRFSRSSFAMPQRFLSRRRKYNEMRRSNSCLPGTNPKLRTSEISRECPFVCGHKGQNSSIRDSGRPYSPGKPCGRRGSRRDQERPARTVYGRMNRIRSNTRRQNSNSKTDKLRQIGREGGPSLLPETHELQNMKFLRDYASKAFEINTSN